MREGIEDLEFALRMISTRSATMADVLANGADIADGEGAQEAIESVQDKVPTMSRMVNIRPMHNDPEKATEAGEDEDIDAIASLLENVTDYAVSSPLRESGVIEE